MLAAVSVPVVAAIVGGVCIVAIIILKIKN
jgi:hypothetical protein